MNSEPRTGQLAYDGEKNAKSMSLEFFRPSSLKLCHLSPAFIFAAVLLGPSPGPIQR